MRRILVLAASLLTFFSAVTPGSAVSPEYAAAQQVAARGCPEPQPSYPPAPNATVAVNISVPSVGERLEISGIHYCPNEDVDITIAGNHVGMASTDHAGAFAAVTTAGAPGPELMCGIGASGLDTDRDCVRIHVRGKSESTAPSSGGGGGSPALTGLQIALLGLIGLVVVVGGVVLNTLGRNRRPERP